MNEFGDLLVETTNIVDRRGNQSFDNRIYVRTEDSGGVSCLEQRLPEVNDWHPSFNSALQIASAPHFGRNKLYRITDGTPELLWQVGKKETLWVEGIAEDGVVYATYSRSGDTRTYRVTESGQMPLTDVRATATGFTRTMSRAGNGDEEVLLTISDSQEYQIFQPNLGARFSLSPWIAPGTLIAHVDAAISPPIGPVGAEAYHAGLIAYTSYVDGDPLVESVILVPVAK